jgi:hypothetical protein
MLALRLFARLQAKPGKEDEAAPAIEPMEVLGCNLPNKTMQKSCEKTGQVWA